MEQAIFIFLRTGQVLHELWEKMQISLLKFIWQPNSQLRKINRTNALSMTIDIIISIFIRRKYKKALEALDLNFSETREIIRPRRSEPRNKKPKKPYSMNYKKL